MKNRNKREYWINLYHGYHSDNTCECNNIDYIFDIAEFTATYNHFIMLRTIFLQFVLSFHFQLFHLWFYLVCAHVSRILLNWCYQWWCHIWVIHWYIGVWGIFRLTFFVSKVAEVVYLVQIDVLYIHNSEDTVRSKYQTKECCVMYGKCHKYAKIAAHIWL